jgi:CMP-N,N'-diacetyllegionaminic acid synthase
MLNKKFLAIVPARKFSKRIKNKNKKKINGKTLIHSSISQSIKSKFINLTVFTTDYPNIKNIDNRKFIYISRPKALCNDNSTTEDVILHTINYLKKKNIIYENIILLQPTSPFRTSKHIDEAIIKYINDKYDSLFSAYLDKLFLWIKNPKLKSKSYNYRKRERTQSMKPFIVENGAIFIFKTKGFLKYKNRLFSKIGYYLMSKKDSLEIDNKDDYILAKKIQL